MGLLIAISLLVALGTLIIFQNFESIFFFYRLIDDSAMINIGERLYISSTSIGAVLYGLFTVLHIRLKRKRKNNFSKYFFAVALSSVGSMMAGVLSTFYYKTPEMYSLQKLSVPMALTCIVIWYLLNWQKDELYPANYLSGQEILIVLWFQCMATVYLVPMISPF